MPVKGLESLVCVLHSERLDTICYASDKVKRLYFGVTASYRFVVESMAAISESIFPLTCPCMIHLNPVLTLHGFC